MEMQRRGFERHHKIRQLSDVTVCKAIFFCLLHGRVMCPLFYVPVVRGPFGPTGRLLHVLSWNLLINTVPFST